MQKNEILENVSQEMIDYFNKSVSNQPAFQNMQLVSDWMDDSYQMVEVSNGKS